MLTVRTHTLRYRVRKEMKPNRVLDFGSQLLNCLSERRLIAPQRGLDHAAARRFATRLGEARKEAKSDVRRSRIAIVATLCAISSGALAQKSIPTELPPSGDYVLFSSQGLAKAVPGESLKSTGGTEMIPLKAGDDRVYVWDRKTGNVASTEVSKVKNSWKPTGKDFSDVAQVSVRVLHDEKPVAAAGVDLYDGRRTSTGIIDPKSDGSVEFFDVKPGPLKVTVTYRTADKTSQSTTQLFNLGLQRAEFAPHFSVALAGDVETVSAAQASTQTTSIPSGPNSSVASAPAGSQRSGAPQSQAANSLGALVVWLVAAAIAIFVILALIRYMKQNPEAAAAKLQQFGVQIPQPGDQGLPDVQPVIPPAPKPEPLQKIMLSGAAPDPSPIAVASFSPTVSSEPSLVAEGGVSIPLMDGETIVGRDPGLGLSLTGETTVSRQHAKLVKVGREVTLTDLGSSNGTYVNGARLQSPVILRPGDAVQFGSARFSYQG